MQTKINIIDNKNITFGDLDVGDIFINCETGYLYVKTALVSESDNALRLGNTEGSKRKYYDARHEVIVPERIEVHV